MTYKNTTRARQNDTLDAIAYRFFGDKSNRILPKLIKENAHFCPHARLPFGAVVILPTVRSLPTANTVKLWD